jgi:hypothetical protein
MRELCLLLVVEVLRKHNQSRQLLLLVVFFRLIVWYVRLFFGFSLLCVRDIGLRGGLFGGKGGILLVFLFCVLGKACLCRRSLDLSEWVRS